MSDRFLTPSSIGLLLEVMEEDDLRPAVLIVRSTLHKISTAAQVYSILRSKITAMRGDAPEQRGLWGILSALMKAAPLVFVPLVQGELAYLVESHLPWKLVETSAVDTTQWCEDMVHSWQCLLPTAQWQAVFGAIRQFRSAALLSKERGDREGRGGSDPQFATAEQVQALHLALDELRGLVRRPASASAAAHGESGSVDYSHVIGALQEPANWVPATGDDDEYVPTHDEGGKILLKNVAAPVQARVARKRQR